MSTLTSASTDDEIEAAYDDNASYDEDNSVSKAKAFITAVRMLIRRLNADAARGVNSVRFDRAALQRELDRAQDFIAGREDPDAPAVTVASFSSGGLR